MSFRLRAILCGLAASLLLTAAPIARAGTYTVYGCQTPFASVAPMDGWHVDLDVAHDAYNYWQATCPGPVFMWMAASHTHPDGAYAEESFIAPADTTVHSYTIWRALRLVPSDGYYYQVWDRSAGQWRLVSGCAGPAGCKNVGDYKHPSASSNVLTHAAETGTTEVQLKVLCGATDGCPSERGGVSASAWLFHSAITLEDDFSPLFAGSPTGPLVAPGSVLAGTVPVTISATDRGGGVYQAMIEVDGHIVQSQVLDSNGGLCRAPFIMIVPCKLSASGTLYFDTRQLADGYHSLRLLVSDAAGNTAAWGPMTIETVNNPCSPIPTAGGMRVRAAFLVRFHKRVRIHRRLRVVDQVRFFDHITANFSRHPLVVGSLTTVAGVPVPGAPICLAARTNVPGAPLRALGVLTTNAAGLFSYRLASGPSRTIYFIHRVLGGAIYQTVTISVHVPVNVHVNSHRLRNGQVMIWRGHLPSPTPGGLLALMEVWRGTYWQSFEQISVPGNGDWVGRYRFERTTGIQNYKFRLAVPQQSGYPFAAGSSRPIQVVVTGP
jgi:hypothetical protein